MDTSKPHIKTVVGTIVDRQSRFRARSRPSCRPCPFCTCRGGGRLGNPDAAETHERLFAEALVGAGTLGDAAHTHQSCLFNIIAFVTKGDFELNRTC